MARYTEDENGYITIPNNPISRSGVFEYLGKEISPELEPDRVYKVWRPEEELNNPETIQSFRLSPWIPRHEMMGKDFTAPEQVGLQGVTGEDVYFENGTLFANLRLFGESLTNAIRAGLKELSCGFRCLWDITSGKTPDGQSYDVVQRQIRGNHLASVPEGRMGQSVAVAMDRAVFALDGLSIDQKEEGGSMTLEELKKALAEGNLTPDEMSALKAHLDEMLGGKEANEEESAERQGESEDMDKAEGEAEDMAEEESAEDKSDDGAAMDSAIKKAMKPLQDKIKALEGRAMDAEMQSRKSDLVAKVSPIIGAFDHSKMTDKQVADYALKKMGVACDGDSVSMLKGVLAAYRKPQSTIDGNGMDSATGADCSDILGELGVS